jgi:hypothetical protein
VAYLLKARTVEAGKQPLLGMPVRNSRGGVMIRDAYSRATYTCTVTLRNSRRGDAGSVLCGSVPRLYDSTDRVQFSE